MLHYPDSAEMPPESGEINFTLPTKPISLQGSSAAKAKLRRDIRAMLTEVGYLLTGEVQVFIEWWIHERLRYEGIHAPDIDNIIKPMLDAMAGPAGIMVNDCQVQAVDVRWLDWTKMDERIDIRLRFDQDLYTEKRGLFFVEFPDRGCMPMHDRMPPEFTRSMLVGFQRSFAARDEILEKTESYEAARSVTPLQRPFHRARLAEFETRPIDEVLDSLN